jgi:hypothetical protein
MNGYQIVSSILQEMPLGAVLRHGAKDIGKRMVKDPVAMGLLVAPVPGSAVASLPAHLWRNKGSARIAKLMARKLFKH